MIKQLAHICIHSTDLDATLRFYTEALGLERGFDFIKKGALFGYYIKFGNDTFIEVFSGDSGKVGNINHFAIEVEGMDAVISRIENAGFEVTEKKLGADHSWQAWVTDPSGVRIELHEYTEKSMQLVGGECPVTW